MSQTILLVEDEPGLVMTLTDRLSNEGYSVEVAEDGETGLDRATNGEFDLIILDVMLPCRSGFDVCRKLRQGGVETPVLMLTARSQVVDKVVGLQIGADDYLTKPFDVMELLARIEALLRRAPGSARKSAPVLQIGPIRVDLRRAEVFRNGSRLQLSAREFTLLRYLLDHRGATVSREELLSRVWGYDSSTTTRTVDVHVAWLRQKLEENPKLPELILTVRGMGYRFNG